MNVRITPKVNAEGFERVLKRTPERLDQATADTSDAFIEDVQDHWSAVSPSSAGEPPAKVSGTLDLSLKKEKEAGTGGLRVAYRIVMADHGAFLEKGTDRMSARPFLQPAIIRQRRAVKDKFKMVIKSE